MLPPMSTALDRRIRSLEAMVLRQAGEIGQLREAAAFARRTDQRSADH